MKNKINNLDEKKRTFGKMFFCSVAGVFALYLFLSFLVDNFVIVSRSVLLSGFFLTLYSAYILSITRYDFKKLYRIFTFVLGVFIFYITLLICSISKAIFFMYVPIVLMILLIASFRKVVFWGIIILILCFFSTQISEFLELPLKKDFYADRPQFLLFQEFIGIVIATYFSFLIIYYNNEFIRFNKEPHDLEIFEASDILEKNNDSSEEAVKFEKYDKDKILYKKIIQCFDEEQPYQKADFNIRKLADILESNSTYVSRALNKIGNKKFNQLVNDYRIDQVKREIANNLHQKFTLEHIYTSAGFSQQSTFNRIFKENTGSTPSEYIENIQQLKENES